MLVCSSFLISVCMFIVSKALLISRATVIVRSGGAIWLNPLATMLLNVCSVVFCYDIMYILCLFACLCVFTWNSTYALLYTEDIISYMNSRFIKSLFNL